MPTGLLRFYISRVENNHSLPAIETLEKMAHAMEIPLYQLFFDGNDPPKALDLSKRCSGDRTAWGHSGKDGRVFDRFRGLLSRMGESDPKLLLAMTQKMTCQTRNGKKAKKWHGN
jgi:transcriptional regulator with XRE-family HTH domain